MMAKEERRGTCAKKVTQAGDLERKRKGTLEEPWERGKSILPSGDWKLTPGRVAVALTERGHKSEKNGGRSRGRGAGGERPGSLCRWRGAITLEAINPTKIGTG